jgi:hypothetical protein
MRRLENVARPALADYIKVNIGMQHDNWSGAGDHKRFDLSQRDAGAVIKMQVNHNLRSPLSFIGTLDYCAERARSLCESGVEEIACLIDFGISTELVLASLRRLAALNS